MPPIRPIKRKDLIYYLKKSGFDGPFPGGKHQYMLKENLSLRIPNPHEHDIDRFFLIKILQQAGISKEEWEKL